jgi:hypothetical protein
MASESDDSRNLQRAASGPSATASAKAVERQRLGAALRENLRRRKAQQQARSGRDRHERDDSAE